MNVLQEKASEVIMLRVRPSEKAAYQQQAGKQAHGNVSQWIRQMANERARVVYTRFPLTKPAGVR